MVRGVTSHRGRRPGPTVRTRVVEHRADDHEPRESHGTSQYHREDRLITEEPLEIRVEAPGLLPTRAWVTMRTPGHDFELAAGWLTNESLADPGAITRVAYCTEDDLPPDQRFNVVTITMAAPIPVPDRHRAASAGASACGVCGKDSVDDALHTRSSAPWPGPKPDAHVVRHLPDALREHQSLFGKTGGVHAAGLADDNGTLHVVREDVGRHNAVDKVVGSRVLAGEHPAAACLVLSGRVGFELVQKAAASGIGAIVAVGAPTSLASKLAQEAGIDLWGFTSRRRAVRYS